jgi:hypothetical protein
VARTDSSTVRNMATLDDVDEIASALPDVTCTVTWGNRSWVVGKKLFCWERPFTKADVKRFGDRPVPGGPIVATRVDDLEEKEAVLTANPRSFFTIPHFDGYSAILIQLPKVSKRALRDAIVDGWLAVAPKRLVDEHADRLVGRRRA